MMQDENVNYFEAKAAFEAYMEANEIDSGWKPFARWLSRNSTKVNYQTGHLPDRAEMAREFETYRQSQGARSTNGNWVELGPSFTPYTQYGIDINGVGRLNVITLDPRDTNVIWVGAPSGGLWHTEDGGASWVSFTDQLPSLGVSAICLHPFDEDVVYIGTGDRDANDAPGVGVMKSTDKGQTFTLINNGMGDVEVGAMLIHPTNPDTLIAAGDDGIYRTVDGGANWTKSQGTSLHFKDLQFKPDDPNIVYAEARGRFYRSDDNGETFTQITNGLPLAFRQVIGVSPADPNRVYILQSYQREFRAFYRSDDAGLSFTTVIVDSPNILGRRADGNDDEGQAFYDLCIAVDPFNADIVYSGGIHIWRSEDGGQSWKINGNRSDITTSRAHVDHHAFAFQEETGKLFNANDGGIYVSPDGNNQYTSISADMGIGQIYRLGSNPQNSRQVLTGFQDNGTSYFDGAKWNRTTGADGMECQYDPGPDNYRYTSIQYGDINRSVNDGQPRRIAGEGENGIDEPGNWITPWQLANHNTEVMFIGYLSLWRSDNLKESNRRDITWRKISGRIGAANAAFNVVEHSQTDSTMLFCSKGVRLFRTNNALDSTASFVELTPGTGAFSIADILTHPRSPDTVYLVQGTDVYRSADTGSTWVNISGTLPDVMMNTIVFDATSREGLYLGGDAGVYFYDDVAQDWVLFFDGLPANVPVRELEIYYGNHSDEHRIRAATYGRGLWESDLIGSSSITFPPVAAIRSLDVQTIYHEGTEVEFTFFRGVNQVEMNGFDVSDVTINNGSLSNFSGGPVVWTADVSATAPGTIEIIVPDQSATDNQGIGNEQSDTFKIAFEGVSASVGIYGPGGVGDANSLALWLRADTALFDDNGGVPVDNDGDLVGYWGSLGGTPVFAGQDEVTKKPQLAAGVLGGSPAIEFEPDTSDGKYFLAQNVVPGADFTAITIASSKTLNYNDHSWTASSRTENGFLLHVQKNQKYWYPGVFDGANNNLTRDRVYLDDVTVPHVYGVTFDQTEVRHEYVTITSTDDLVQRSPTFFIPRSNTDSIQIKYGWDFDARYGSGYIGEAIIMNRRLYTSHTNILRNYFNARYGIDIGDVDFYAHDLGHGNDVAGIGRESFYDLHTDAKGMGEVRFRNAYDLGDGEYMIWGHDDGGTGQWISTNVPQGFQRIEREWRLDKTGVIGEAELLVLSGDLPSSNETIGILVADDANFSQGVYALPFKIDGDTLWESIFMDDDAYFTFVSAPRSAYDQYTGIEDLKEAQLLLYPNPSSDLVTIQLVSESQIGEDLRLEMIDMTGSIIMSKAIKGNANVLIDVSEFASGIYQVIVSGSKGEPYTERLMISR